MPDIDLDDLFTAIALVFVLEGLSLAAFPGSLRRALQRIEQIPHDALRWGGLLMAFLGVLCLYILRG